MAARMALYMRSSPMLHEARNNTRGGKGKRAQFPSGKPIGPTKMMLISTAEWEDHLEKSGYTAEDVTRWEKEDTLRLRIRKQAWQCEGGKFDDYNTGWKSERQRRVGLIAKKIGMKTELDWWGKPTPCTLLSVQGNQVTEIRTEHNNGYTAVQIGAGVGNVKRMNKAVLGQYKRTGIEPKKLLREFPVTQDAIVPVGTELNANHFRAGQFLDVYGITKSFGIQGVMQRHNMSGQRATHGVSKTHRAVGGIGACQWPGKVWKGKRMAGHDGGVGKRMTHIKLIKVNVKKNILYVKGSIPGPKGSWVEVSDCLYRPNIFPSPFPTDFRQPEEMPTEFRHWQYSDPMAKQREIDWELKWLDTKRALTVQQQQKGSSFDDDDD